MKIRKESWQAEVWALGTMSERGGLYIWKARWHIHRRNRRENKAEPEFFQQLETLLQL